MTPVSSSPRFVLFLFSAGACLALLLGGCGGASSYSLNEGDLAQRFLPTERKVDHHPDSLRSLSIREDDRRIHFDLAENYESLHRKWSSTYQDLGAGRSRRGRSYATFWSLELSLASLQPEVGVTSLTKERARESLDERRKEYNSTLQFDIYWFESEGNTLLAGPGSQVRLQVDGEKTYRPSEETHGPLRETFLAGQTRSALYRRNTFYFSRVVDSTDILKDAQEIELLVDRAGVGSRVRFSWSWDPTAESSAGRPFPQYRQTEGGGQAPQAVAVTPR